MLEIQLITIENSSDSRQTHKQNCDHQNSICLWFVCIWAQCVCENWANVVVCILKKKKRKNERNIQIKKLPFIWP